MAGTDNKRLTLFEAAALIAGNGVGGGIMAVPYLASLNGIVTIVSIMLGAYGLSLVLHLMIAETIFRDGGDRQLVEIFDKYVFRGTIGKYLTWLFMILLGAGFTCNLAGYIAGCGEAISELVPIPLQVSEILVYVVAAGVVLFGLKAIGLSEKIAISGMAVLLVALTIGSIGKMTNELPLIAGKWNQGFALYGMIMFSFACFFAVPQAAVGLSWNRRLLPWSIALGIAINFTLVLVITVMSMLVSKEVTEVAIIGWSASTGKWALVAGSVFAVLAMLTSYWTLSYALSVILMERFDMQYRTAWAVTTLPTILLAITGATSFLGFMRITGGAIAVMLSVLVVPALRRSRQEEPDRELPFRLGLWGSGIMQAIIILAYVMMAVGSVVSYD